MGSPYEVESRPTEEFNILSFYEKKSPLWMVANFEVSPVGEGVMLNNMPSAYVIPDDWRFDVAKTLAFYRKQPAEGALRGFYKTSFSGSIKERPFAKLVAWSHALSVAPDGRWITISPDDLGVDRYYTASLVYLVFRQGNDTQQAIFTKQLVMLLNDPVISKAMDREGILLGAALALSKYGISRPIPNEQWEAASREERVKLTYIKPKIPPALTDLITVVSKQAKEEKPEGPLVENLIKHFITLRSKISTRTDRTLK